MSHQSDLEDLVIDDVLPDQATVEWRPAAGEHFPNPHDGELVVFEDFYHRDSVCRRTLSSATFSFSMGLPSFI
jgi:hypothetical protein